MLLKRKRSDDELSCFSGGGVGYSSPMRSDSGDVVMMDTESPISPRTTMLPLSPSVQNRSRSCTPSHLPSRTFKRLRNGRPSEEEVHRTCFSDSENQCLGFSTLLLIDSLEYSQKILSRFSSRRKPRINNSGMIISSLRPHLPTPFLSCHRRHLHGHHLSRNSRHSTAFGNSPMHSRPSPRRHRQRPSPSPHHLPRRWSTVPRHAKTVELRLARRTL